MYPMHFDTPAQHLHRVQSFLGRLEILLAQRRRDASTRRSSDDDSATDISSRTASFPFVLAFQRLLATVVATSFRQQCLRA